VGMSSLQGQQVFIIKHNLIFHLYLVSKTDFVCKFPDHPVSDKLIIFSLITFFHDTENAFCCLTFQSVCTFTHVMLNEMLKFQWFLLHYR
jgi:hypothetical protein